MVASQTDISTSVSERPFGWVASVRVVGVGDALARTLEQELVTRPGMELHEAPLRDDVRRLWKSGVVSDARVEFAPDGGVRFAVTPRAPIARVEIRGGDPAMARRFRLLEGVMYEPARIRRMADVARLAYVREGRIDAVVEPHAVVRPGRVDVCVQATMGPKVTIAEWRFPGPTVFREDQLLGAMTSGPTINRTGGIYDPDAWTVDARHLQNFYMDRGYAEAEIGAPRTRRIGDRLFVDVPIKTGSLFRFGQISIKPRLVYAMPMRTAQVYSRALVLEVREALEQRPDVKTVVSKYRIDPATDHIDIEFEVEMK